MSTHEPTSPHKLESARTTYSLFFPAYLCLSPSVSGYFLLRYLLLSSLHPFPLILITFAVLLYSFSFMQTSNLVKFLPSLFCFVFLCLKLHAILHQFFVDVFLRIFTKCGPQQFQLFTYRFMHQSSFTRLQDT